MHWILRLAMPYIIPMVLEGLRDLADMTENTIDDYVVDKFTVNQKDLVKVVMAQKSKPKRIK